MFLVLLELSENKASASEHMQGHKAWLQRGFDDGVFVLAGSLKPAGGGGISAGVVSAQVVEIAPSRVDERLAFLRGE